MGAKPTDKVIAGPATGKSAVASAKGFPATAGYSTRKSAAAFL